MNSIVGKNILVVTLFLLSVVVALAQEGVGTSTPDKSAALEVQSKKRGLLIPRIELKAINVSDPVDKPANSLLVYNTATSSSIVSGTYKVTPGYYYWLKDENTPSNSKWVRLITNGFYTAGEGMTLSSTEFSRNGLQELNSTGTVIVRTATSTGDYGWRYIGLDQTNYARIGKYATDLSYAPVDVDISNNGDFTSINSGYSTVEYRKVELFNDKLNFKEFGASGKYSFASGLMNNGIGDYSFTAGLANYNESVLGISLGNFNQTIGKYCVAIGTNNKVIPESILSTSGNIKVDSEKSYVIGSDNISKAPISVVLGSANGNTSSSATAPGEVTGIQAVVIGRSNGATGENSVAIGTKNLPSALYAVTIGAQLTASSYGSSAFGFNNTLEESPQGYKPPSLLDYTKRVFVLGNGFSSAGKSDALTILRNGQMGVDIDNFETAYTSDVSKGHISDAKLQVNGTAQMRKLPKNGENSYTPDRTVVADSRGVLGYIDGLPPSYVRKTTPINRNTPSASETTLGNLSIRYNGSGTGATTIQFKLKKASYVTLWSERRGSGGGNDAYSQYSVNAEDWKDITTSGIINYMTVNPGNRDMIRYTLNLHNTKEVYRVSIVSNDYIPANGTIDAVPAQLTIFIEKLD